VEPTADNLKAPAPIALRALLGVLGVASITAMAICVFAWAGWFYEWDSFAIGAPHESDAQHTVRFVHKRDVRYITESDETRLCVLHNLGRWSGVAAMVLLPIYFLIIRPAERRYGPLKQNLMPRMTRVPPPLRAAV
jgi:hypothetical protein